MKDLGIYIHIPFCKSKCIYCDFLSFAHCENEYLRYVDALVKEIKMAPSEGYCVKTIFFGGGTPSIIDEKYIVKLLEEIRSHYVTDENAEITIECNPGTVNRNKLMVYHNAGINRISFGLQSVDDSELSKLGRIHTYEQFLESYEAARKCGFDNINIDLMSGLSGQTAESYSNTLRTVCELNPEHISAYSLIVEEGTPLYSMVQSGKYVLPGEEVDRQIYHVTQNILNEYGYKRYEISNYSKPQYECRHNLSYWERTDYRGFGIGAASLIEHKRMTCVTDFDEYYTRIEKGENPFEEIEELTAKDEMAEFMFLGLRKIEGIDKTEFYHNFGVSYDSIYGSISEKYIKLNMIKEEKNRVFLTEQGLDVSNVIMSEYIL